jgi:hypothetical protein
MIQESKYLVYFDLMSKETEDKTIETGNFRWTLNNQFFGDELEVIFNIPIFITFLTIN